MTDISWPSGVPEAPERDGYNEELRPNIASFEPEAGPPTSWRRSTVDSGLVSAAFIMTTAERDLFKTFYRTTLKDGSLPFSWDNPSYSSAARHLFDPKSPPSWQAIGADLWRVRVSFIRLA